ncbi:MAG: serine--tRNA ligase [Candidatus Cloacimonetes bacterium]|nr:serine--tRNA ligase [Candidatus Cloacimonadota bacterium]
MLDIKYIRENQNIVRKAISDKGEEAELDKILELDEKHRKLLYQFEKKREYQNAVSKKIGEMKKAGKDAHDLINDMKGVASEVKELNSRISEIEQNLNKLLLTIPNIIHEDVPIGKKEDDNKLIREWGEKPEFDFEIKDHLELAENLQLLDFDRAAKITGSGFVSYTDRGAQLERALLNFMLDYHIKNYGYTEISPPYVVNRNTMTGTGQLPKLESDMYNIEEEDYFLIPTAEVPLTNLYSEEILYEDKLPTKLIANTPCFRREAGSYGKKTRGLIRMHQFNKVELVQLVKPEDSAEVLLEILSQAEAILRELGLHYRISMLCSGDLSFAAHKCYDIEVWAPGMGKYLEVSSCSNFLDFQARRANIRFRSNKDNQVHFVHTLNGSGLATPRTMIAILESFQVQSGGINLPESLKKYFRLNSLMPQS